MPEPVPASAWAFPDVSQLPDVEGDPQGEADLVAIGADLEPSTLLTAYAHGLFPMPVGEAGQPMAWWSPAERAVLPVDGLRITRSLRRSVRRYATTVDHAFAEVVERCADPARDGGWIDPEVVRAYVRLHELGWAHSVETWLDGRLVGGLYGVAIGGLFAGESMFHRERDASKVALVRLVDILDDGVDRLLDVQWPTPHLHSLGAVTMPRSLYVPAVRAAVTRPLPQIWR